MTTPCRFVASLLSICVTLLAFALSQALCQPKPVLLDRDRIRLAEAFRLADELGNIIWKDWDEAPFAVLLVTTEHEFLIRHLKPTIDFSLISYDSLLQSNVYYRKRVFQPNLLATFPAVSGVPTIVVGQAENTNVENSTRWVLAVLHEHFHQLQTSQPSYYPDVEALNLSRGDQTGTWMLNYPFPYDSSTINEQFSSLCTKLSDALRSRRSMDFRPKVAAYLRAREEFRRHLSDDDYRYFSFQVWQEGVARYTEYRIASLAGQLFEPSESFRSLPDFTPFKAEADTLHEGLPKALPLFSLAALKRIAFYPLGAGEAFLLDAVNSAWRELYFKEKFFLERYFQR